MRTVFITGVSTGVGRATAAVLVERGWRVFGSVRKDADVAGLSQQFGDAFVPLIFDVQDDAAVRAAAESVREKLGGRTLHGLVNNAGSSFSNPLLVQSVAEFRQQIEVNLIGAFAVTRAFAPLLGVDETLSGPKGRIVNISSVGGVMALPFLGAYAAAKHGIEGFSESLRRELLVADVDVIVIGPGSVRTAIWDKAEAMPLDHLKGTRWEAPFGAFHRMMIEDGRKGMQPEAVAEVVATALTARRPKTRYAPVRGKLANVTLPSLLPKRMVDRLIGRRLGLLH